MKATVSSTSSRLVEYSATQYTRLRKRSGWASSPIGSRSGVERPRASDPVRVARASSASLRGTVRSSRESLITKNRAGSPAAPRERWTPNRVTRAPAVSATARTRRSSVRAVASRLPISRCRAGREASATRVSSSSLRSSRLEASWGTTKK